MKPIRWLNLEAYGATLEMWRNAHGQFYFVALGGTEAAKEAMFELGGKMGSFFNKRVVGIHFPPLSSEASASQWIERLPLAFLEERDRTQVLLVKPDANGAFSEEMKAAAEARGKQWEERAREIELQAAEDEFDIPGFSDDIEPTEPAPAAEAAPTVQAEIQPALETPAAAEPSVEPTTSAPVEAPAPAAAVAPAEPAASKASLEQFIERLHEGDDRAFLRTFYRDMPDDQEFARIEALDASAALLMTPSLGIFAEVRRRLSDDAQIALMLVGRSEERMVMSVNRFMAEPEGTGLVTAVWGGDSNGAHRMVMLFDPTLPADRHLTSLDAAAIPRVADEVEMAVYLNSLWRDVYGQEDQAVSVAAGVPESGNAADLRTGADREGVPGVHRSAELAEVEGDAPARPGVPGGASAGTGPDAAARSGGLRGPEHGAREAGVHAGQPGDAGDAGRSATVPRAAAGQSDRTDRELPDRGDGGGHGADVADRAGRAGESAGERDEPGRVDQPVSRRATAASGRRTGDVVPEEAEAPLAEAELQGTHLSAEDQARIQAEIEARHAERRRGLDLNFEETSGRIAYQPASNLQPQGTMVPANMATAITGALVRLEERHGDIDNFVARQLGFEMAAEMEGRLYAEQVDAVALALDSFGRGRDMVLGDLTGIGKGRVLASVIRYAHQNGIPAIFLTKDQTLYNSMSREMAVLGMSDLVDRRRLLITSTGVGIENDQGEAMVKGRSGAELNAIYESGELPEGVRLVFTCHSQLMTAADAPRVEWLTRIARDALVIVDESHLSAGVDSLCGANLRAISEAARHTLYSSATSAKEAKNLSLYSGTDLSLLGGAGRIEEILKKGGSAAMEAVPMMLAQEGQYIRREHDLSNAEYRAPEVPEQYVPVIRANMDALSGALRALMDLQHVVTSYTAQLNGEDYFTRQRAAEERRRRGREQMGLSSMHFSSTLHHFTQQALLAVHADFFADMAIASAREGNKPVLVVQSTMESVLAEVVKVLVDHNVNPDGAEVEMSFASVLERMAKKITEVNVTYAGERHAFNLQDQMINLQGRALPEQLQILLAGRHLQVNNDVRAVLEEFRAALQRIPTEIPVSPIDYISDKMRAAGFEMGELTGRRWKAEQVRPGTYRLQRRRDSAKRDRQRIQNEFNNGITTGILINKAGATGIDLHSDLRFVDQRRRDLMVLQADDDIYVFQQALGRVFRANMAVAPRYTLPGSAVPVAVRGMAIMRRRLSNMMSLTRGSRDAEMGGAMPDLFNWVGCEAAMDYLQNNRGVADALNIDLGVEEGRLRDHGGDTGLAARLTAMGLLLPYENKLEDLERRGINPFRSRHLDVRARVVNEVVLQPATGDSVFQGAVILKELVYEEELPALTPETVETMIRVGRGALSMAEGATRNWSRQPVLEVMPEIEARMEGRLRNLRDLFTGGDGGAEQTLEDLANTRHESFAIRAAREHLGMRALAPRVKLGAHLSLRLDSDQPIDFHVVGIDPPTWGNDLHSLYEWRLLLVSKDQHARQARVPLSLLLNEAMEVQRNAFMAQDDADPAAFTVDWENLASAVSDPERDLIDDQGRMFPAVLAEYQDLPRGRVEMRRHVLAGNVLKAIIMAGDLHKGLPATYTLANGSREYGVLMPASFDEIKLLRMPVTLESADAVQNYMSHRLQSRRDVKMFMNLGNCTLPGVVAKDVEQAKKDLNSSFYLEFVRSQKGVEAKILVPRAKGRSGWLVTDEQIAALTTGKQWSRVAQDLGMSFRVVDGQLPADLRGIIDRLIEVGVTLRTPASDTSAREWLIASEQQAAQARNQVLAIEGRERA
jgi:hypothetical protein